MHPLIINNANDTLTAFFYNHSVLFMIWSAPAGLAWFVWTGSWGIQVDRLSAAAPFGSEDHAVTGWGRLSKYV